MSTERVWNSFLTDRDKAHIDIVDEREPFGLGTKPAVLAIDNHRWVIGDEPMPILEAIKTWPGSTGLEGWESLSHIEELLSVARQVPIPVVHVTGGVQGVPPWGRPTAPRDDDEAALERESRRYEIVPQAAPEVGEALMHKVAPSAFFGTPLVSHLRALEIDTLIVCGESTSGCVRASVVDGCSYRFSMVVVEECVYDRHQAAHALSLFDMHQKYADIIPLQSAITWLKEYQKR